MSAPPSTSTEFDAEVQNLVDESPKLDAACKNLIALLSAKSMPTDEPVPITELLSCARVLLKQLNAHVLVDVVEWGSKHPQGEHTALERIDQLREYKVVHALRARVDQMKGKVSKLFGKSFILWSGCWKEVRAECEVNQPRDVPDDVFALFLDSFELSLGLHKSEESGRIQVEESNEAQKQQEQEQNNDAINTVLHALSVKAPVVRPPLKASAEDRDLIWAASFNEALAVRRKARESKIPAQREWKDHTVNQNDEGTIGTNFAETPVGPV